MQSRIKARHVVAWFQNNVLHRDNDMPAVVWQNRRLWYQNGVLHRIDKPAMMYRDGGSIWYYVGLPHRIDGPAVDRANHGYRAWYYFGKRVSCKTDISLWIPFVQDGMR